MGGVTTVIEAYQNCLPKVTARVYNPPSCRPLPHLFPHQRILIPEQLQSQFVLGRLEEGTEPIVDDFDHGLPPIPAAAWMARTVIAHSTLVERRLTPKMCHQVTVVQFIRPADVGQRQTDRRWNLLPIGDQVRSWRRHVHVNVVHCFRRRSALVHRNRFAIFGVFWTRWRNF